MLSRHLPLVLLNEKSKILVYHSLLRRPINYILGILFIFYSMLFDFTGVISMRYYMFSGLLSVQAFLPWSPVELVY